VVKVPKHIKWANSFAGWIATLFPNVWGGILTTAAATAAAVWGLGIRFLESTSVQSVILLFVSLFWTFIGVVFLADRNRPRPVHVQKDISYGIVIERISANYDPLDSEKVLSVSVSIRNYTLSALRYELEKFELLSSNRIIRASKGQFYGLLQRGGGKTSTSDAFTKDDIKELIGKQVEGSIDLEIAYGVADEQFTRVFKVSLRLFLNFKTEHVCYASHNIISESDEPYISR
jgi:hypothetical protein